MSTCRSLGGEGGRVGRFERERKSLARLLCDLRCLRFCLVRKNGQGPVSGSYVASAKCLMPRASCPGQPKRLAMCR